MLGKTEMVQEYGQGRDTGVIRNLPRNYKIALVFMRIISRKGEDSAREISSTPAFVIDIYAQCQERNGAERKPRNS
jgi:hypothetical protein